MKFKDEVEKLKNKDNYSFLGIDGGNIEKAVWFCGIEFGGNIKMMEEYFNLQVKFNPKNNSPYRDDCVGIYMDSKYDRSLSKMYIHLFKEDKDIDEVLKKVLYSMDSEIFKLNLYPLAKKNAGKFDENITKIFQIAEEKYYGEYFDYRKEFLKKINKEFRPKNKNRIIICTAVKNSETQFVEAFFHKDKKIEYTWKYLENNGKTFKISVYNQDSTTLLIIPFLGMGNGNLNSYEDVIFMANHLRDKYLKKVIGE
jgi:hypothetical protein